MENVEKHVPEVWYENHSIMQTITTKDYSGSPVSADVYAGYYGTVRMEEQNTVDSEDELNWIILNRAADVPEFSGSVFKEPYTEANSSLDTIKSSSENQGD